MLILLAVGPPLLAGGWMKFGALLFPGEETAFTEVTLLPEEDFIFSEQVAFYVCRVPSQGAQPDGQPSD
jgi:hypothetical protein